ncbi:MAG: RNA polymerase sigma factor [Candidatus Promineifilaceae bacterium]
MITMVDTQLLKQARRLEKRALTEIYDRYNHDLYRYAMRALGDPDRAEECVAETFSRLLHALKRGGGPKDHLRAYLYRTAHNWLTDQYRRQPPPSVTLDDIQLAGEGSLSKSVEQSQEQARVRHALATLTADQQQVILLKYYEGWSNKAVAEVLGKPVGAIKSLQHRALKALKRALLQAEKELIQ